MKRFILGLAIFIIAALLIGLAGCTSGTKTSSDNASGKDQAGSQQASDDQLSKVAEKTASQNSPADPGQSDQSGSTAQQGKTPYAVVETNKGKIVFQMFPHKAPKTVENFVKLANAHFYDGIKWHRVEPGFVIQGGDPLSKDSDPANDGLGGPGYTIPPEFNDVPHTKGTVAMARAQDPNSGGSQFYICLDNQPQLDGKYTVFGQVVEGQDVVDQIQKFDVMTRVYIEYR